MTEALDYQPLLLALMSSGAAMIVALVSSVAAYYRATDEIRREQRFRHENRQQDARMVALHELAQVCGAISHHVTWLTWFAAYGPEDKLESAIELYESNVAEPFLRLHAANTHLSFLSQKSGQLYQPIIRALYSIEGTVARAIHSNATPTEKRQHLATLYMPAIWFHLRLPELFFQDDGTAPSGGPFWPPKDVALFLEFNKRRSDWADVPLSVPERP